MSTCEFCGNPEHVGHQRDCITMPGGTVRRPDDTAPAGVEVGPSRGLRPLAPEGVPDGHRFPRIVGWLRNSAEGLRTQARWFKETGAGDWAEREAAAMDEHAEWLLARMPESQAPARTPSAASAASAPEGQSPPHELGYALTCAERERDAAIARVAAAEKERDEARDYYHQQGAYQRVTIDSLMRQREESQAKLAAAEAQAGRLRESWIAARHVVFAARAVVGRSEFGDLDGAVRELAERVTAYDQRHHEAPTDTGKSGGGEA